LLTVHMNPAIALQRVWGSYNGQQRPLTSKKDTKKHITVWSGVRFPEISNNLVWIIKSGPGAFLEILQGVR
jgi:hypothetical protein